MNVGFGQDKLLTNDGNKWSYKNKRCGMMGVATSLWLVLLWDMEGGLTQIDMFLYSTEDYIKVCYVTWLSCGSSSPSIPSFLLPSLELFLGLGLGLGLGTLSHRNASSSVALSIAFDSCRQVMNYAYTHAWPIIASDEHRA